MKKVLAFNGSPRRFGNTSVLLKHFRKGAETNSPIFREVLMNDLKLDHCNGCLRCNLIGRCSITGDDWQDLSQDILDADVLVFASPVYFHHLAGPMKVLIDRFRSFVKVQITESGLKHIPWQEWNKEFVLLLSMGSSDDSDARAIIELFEYMRSILGSSNKLSVISATRLAVIRQIEKTEEELSELYPKLGLSQNLVSADAQKNKLILDNCYQLGINSTNS
ncbi:MAG: flavodoxin family protein [Bacteroidales bacterium]|nr:flavodoxin family protein [Bacteroidales bacterium]